MPRKNPFADFGNTPTVGDLDSSNNSTATTETPTANAVTKDVPAYDQTPNRGNPFGPRDPASDIVTLSLKPHPADNDLFAPPSILTQDAIIPASGSELSIQKLLPPSTHGRSPDHKRETNVTTNTVVTNLFSDDGGGDTLARHMEGNSERHRVGAEKLSTSASENIFRPRSGTTSNKNIPTSLNPLFAEHDQEHQESGNSVQSSQKSEGQKICGVHAEDKIAQLTADCDDLRRQLREAQHLLGTVSSEKMSPRLAIRAALRGGPLTLDMYKSRSEKEELLDAASVCGHGDILKMCCRFVASTLATHVVHDVMRTRPVVCQHFAVMLRQRQQWDQLLNLYDGVGWQAERGMLLFERAISEHNPSVRCSQLEHCLLLAEQGVCLTNVAAHLRASIALLQTQTAIEAYDANPRHTADNEAFTRFPKRRGVPLTPAIATLYYGCLYHFHTKDTAKNPAYPPALRKGFGTGIDIHESHYLWTAVKARAHARDWASIESLLTVKSRIFGNKLKPAIAPAGVAKILLRCGAPREEAVKYIVLVDDLDRRWQLYASAGCHLEVVQTLIEMKNAPQLEKYYQKPEVIGDFVIRQKAFDALQKWGVA